MKFETHGVKSFKNLVFWNSGFCGWCGDWAERGKLGVLGGVASPITKKPHSVFLTVGGSEKVSCMPQGSDIKNIETLGENTPRTFNPLTRFRNCRCGWAEEVRVLDLEDSPIFFGSSHRNENDDLRGSTFCFSCVAIGGWETIVHPPRVGQNCI